MPYTHTPVKLFSLFMVVLFSVTYSSCTRAVYPNKSDIKEFFTQFEYLTNRDSATYSFYHKKILVIDSVELAWEKYEIRHVKKSDSLIGKERNWLKRQLRNNTIITWDTSFFNSPLIKEVEVVSRRYKDSLFHFAPKGPDRLGVEYIHLGIPLFSRDKKYCLLIFDQWCGSECAESAMIVYKKVDGKWERYITYFQSVS